MWEGSRSRSFWPSSSCPSRSPPRRAPGRSPAFARGFGAAGCGALSRELLDPLLSLVPHETGRHPQDSLGSFLRPVERRDQRDSLSSRDEKKNPLISTFNWTEEATQRILRVPAGFMRNKTQERIEELARERAAACRAEASGEGGGSIWRSSRRGSRWAEDDGRNDRDLLPSHIDEREAQPQRGEPADRTRCAGRASESVM